MYAGVKVQCSVTMFLFWFSVSDIHYNIRLYDCGSNCQAITVLALFGFLYLYWLLTDFTCIFFSDRMHPIKTKKKRKGYTNQPAISFNVTKAARLNHLLDL